MSSFHNTGSVSSQVGQQSVGGNVVHGGAHYYLDGAESSKRLRFQHNEADLEKALDDEVLESLAYPEMFYRRADIKTPHRKTCQWIFDLAGYNSWASNSSGLLWIKGKPGAGKSTLMAHLYHSSRLHNITEQTLHLEFFFTARGAPLQRSPLGMFRSLLNQIFRQDIQTRSILRKPYQEKQQSFGRSSRSWEWQQSELESLLVDMVLLSAKRQPLLIFVDALDEAGQEAAQQMACYFHDLNDQLLEQSTKAKICLSCRHYPVMPRFQATEISVEDHNQDDITAYVKSHLAINKLLSDRAEDHEEWQALTQSLVENSRGVFQWTFLVVPQIKTFIINGDTPTRIRKWLTQVPQELGQVYQSILEQLAGHDYSTQSKRLFQWVCLATRPLTVTEVRSALMIHDSLSQSDGFDFDHGNEVMIRRIRSWSGGLIEVVGRLEESKDPEQSIQEEVVQPIHQSVNDFYLSKGLLLLARFESDHQTPGSIGGITLGPDTISMYHGELYWCCLNYLSQIDVESIHVLPQISPWDTDTIKALERIQTSFPLLQYSTSSCLPHGEKAKGYRGGHLAKEFEILCRAIPIWVCLQSVMKEAMYINLIDGTMPLHVAAAANLIDLAVFILEQKTDVDAFNMRGETALHIAAGQGHLAMVKILVDFKIDIQQMTKDGKTPLVSAAARGHVEVFSWLVSRGANLNASTTQAGTALYAAAEHGNITVARLCIESGATVNAQGGKYGNALQAASLHNHPTVVQILLDAGAEVNTQGGEYSNALQAASYWGHDEVVHILLSAGAEVNAQAGTYGNALQAASLHNYQTVVQILLDAGAEVNAQGGRYGNALQAASSGGYKEVVQILLDTGAEVNAQGGEYGNALQAASSDGSKAVVQILLNAGAEVNAQGGQYGNALQAASYRGSKEVVQILLDAGAEVNTQGGEYGNALQAASYWGHDEVVHILLSAGAEVNAQGGYYGNALQAAACHSSEEVLKILLDTGAKVNTQGGEYGNALQAASYRGSKEVVQILLDAGAEVNTQGGEYGNALQAASYWGHDEVVHILLSAGADVNAQGGVFDNALKAASLSGHETITQMLRAAGAEKTTPFESDIDE